MAHLDRLTALLEHFKLRVEGAPLQRANLALLRGPDRLMFAPRMDGLQSVRGDIAFGLRVDFGNKLNPLRMALPERLELDVCADPDLENLCALLASEQQGQRCGAPAVLGRLGEVLVVRLLRHQIEHGAATPGLLGGLAHPRVSAALVAMHEDPGRAWHNADLAQVAGLSNSRFKEVFSEAVGQSPASYLRRWRLTRARMDLEQGARVDRIAYRYGYRAADAFSRAFRKEFGVLPREVAKAG